MPKNMEAWGQKHSHTYEVIDGVTYLTCGCLQVKPPNADEITRQAAARVSTGRVFPARPSKRPRD